jgi:hypothetical protein
MPQSLPGYLRNKRSIQYEFLDTQNYVSELNKQELFQHQNFKSSLKQKNISESEYNNYKELSKNMCCFEYLEWYTRCIDNVSNHQFSY